MLPGPGDQVDRFDAQLGVAVGQQRDRLRAADRVDLVHPEQLRRRPGWSGAAGRRSPAAAASRPPATATPAACAGHHVHHHRGRVDRDAARHVQADPVHRQPLLGDRAAGHHLAPRRSPRRCSACTSRARRIDSVQRRAGPPGPARPAPRPAPAAGTRGSGTSTPSNRSVGLPGARRSRARGPARRSGLTAPSAASTSSAARGSTRRSARTLDRRRRHPSTRRSTRRSISPV